MDSILIGKYQNHCLDTPGGFPPCKVSINKHRNGDFMSPLFRHIRRNIFLGIPMEIKTVIFFEELRTDSWVATMKH